MKILIKYITVILFMSMFFSCGAEFVQYDLAKDYETGLLIAGSSSSGEEEVDQRKGTPALKYYQGDLLDGAIWWAKKGLKLDKEDDFMVIADSVGPGLEHFGSTFPPLDFISEKVQIKVTANIEESTSETVELQLELVDDRGFATNAKRPVQRIKKTDDTVEYLFDLNGVFNQLKPTPHKVNGGMVNSIRIYLNPGGNPFSGAILMDEIMVIKKSPQ